MQLTMDISERDVAEFGKEAIQQEFENVLKWIRIKQAFRRIAADLSAFDAREYAHEIENIRESAWNEYQQKKDYHQIITTDKIFELIR